MSPLTGPAAMMARILPLRLAAPVGSAVARACVARKVASTDDISGAGYGMLGPAPIRERASLSHFARTRIKWSL
jgi:hypothetical protein